MTTPRSNPGFPARSPIVALLFVASIAAVSDGASAADQPRPRVGRSMVATRYGVVAASQPLAARAGTLMLERGGNALDAAIAANATIGVMEPTGNGIGGDLFLLYWNAREKKLYGLNSSGWAATGATPEALAAKGITRLPTRGVHTITVPGVVAGWHAARERLGTLPMADLLAPAIHHAEEGFPVSEMIATLWSRSQDLLAATPNSARTFLVDGKTPKAGDTFRNPDLAKTLRGVAQKGRDAYYSGSNAEAIVSVIRANGGSMTLADLAEFQPEWVEPITTTYRGWTVAQIPPQTQGIAALMMLNIMETFPVREFGFHSPKALHTMIEAKKLAYADMLAAVGDPRFFDVPVARMLDKGRAAERAKLIDPAKAACSVKADALPGITDSEGKDTIYLTTVDREGNVASLIQSNYSGFGSGLVPDGAGFMLHNRGALFTLEKGRPNTLAPRKRPLHTIIPGFMMKDGVAIGFGIMGGWNQAQAHAQFVSNVVDHGFTLQEALEAGRFTKGTFQGCDVEIEENVPEATRSALSALGHQLDVVRGRSSNFGFGQAVMARPDGARFGASDPRHDGAAIPQSPPVFESGPGGRGASRR
jgi:gamma-glutamyltranspeptidase/glutathione hydrolase